MCLTDRITFVVYDFDVREAHISSTKLSQSTADGRWGLTTACDDQLTCPNCIVMKYVIKF